MASVMAADRQRLVLFAIWLAGFFASLLVMLWIAVASTDNQIAAVEPHIPDVIGMFAPYLTPILVFWFAKRSEEAAVSDSIAYAIAWATSALYNTIVFAIILSVLLAESADDFSQRAKFAKDISALLAFLVGPAIGYYFGKAV